MIYYDVLMLYYTITYPLKLVGRRLERRGLVHEELV